MFEIMHFDLAPAWVRWAYADFINKDEGYEMYPTVDDLDNDFDSPWFYYVILFSDGHWAVAESLEDAHYQLIDCMFCCPKCGSDLQNVRYVDESLPSWEGLKGHCPKCKEEVYDDIA